MKLTQQITLSALLALSSISYVYAHGTDNRNKAEVIHDDWMQDDDMPVTKATIMESKKKNNKTSNNEQEKLHDEWMRDDDMPTGQDQHKNHSHK